MSSWLWLTYALLTPVFWAVNNVLDRMMMTRLMRNEYALTFLGALSRLPFFLIFFAMTGFYVPPLREFLLSLVAGFLVVFPIIFYLRALERDEATSMIIIYDATNPLFVLFLSAAFLAERLNLFEGLGFFILLLAGVLASIEFHGKFQVRRGAFWIILSALLWAPADVLLGYLVPKFPSVLSLLTWEFFGSFVAGFLFLLAPQFRRRCRLADFNWPMKWWVIYGIAAIIAYAGYFTFLKAFELERVSLTVVMTNIQPLLVFLFGLAAAAISPLFVKPDTSPRHLIPKGIAFLLVILGVYLLQA